MNVWMLIGGIVLLIASMVFHNLADHAVGWKGATLGILQYVAAFLGASLFVGSFL